MPAEFEIFLDYNLVYARYQGAIVVEEISTLMLRYRSHVDYSPHQRQLIDLSRVTLVKLEMPAFLAIQQQVLQAQNLHAPTTRLVFFCPQCPVTGYRRKFAKFLGALPFGPRFYR